MSKEQELTDRVKELRTELSDAVAELCEYHCKGFSEKTGIVVGCVLLGAPGDSYLVSRLVGSDWGMINVYGRRLKKNGTPGCRETLLMCPEKMRIVD